MTEQIQGTESEMVASRFAANVCYLGLTPKPDPEARPRSRTKKISRAAFKADYLLALVTLEDGEEPGENDVSELASPPAHSQELGWLSNFPFRLRSEIHGDTEAVSLEKGLAVFRVVANHLR